MTTEMLQGPQKEAKLKISDVAMFFDKSVQWVRWCESAGYFQYEDGTEIVPERTEPRRAAVGYRKYSHEMIDKMADSLYRRTKISHAEYVVIKGKVKPFLTEVD